MARSWRFCLLFLGTLTLPVANGTSRYFIQPDGTIFNETPGHDDLFIDKFLETGVGDW